jgi:hypothetical protein
MDSIAIRRQLHEYIDIADDHRVEAIYTLLIGEKERNYSYSADELHLLHERAESYLKNGGATYTPEISHAKIRADKSKE